MILFQCLANCDAEGIKYRMVQCVWPQTSRPANGGACRHLGRPPQTKPCKGPPCPEENGKLFKASLESIKITVTLITSVHRTTPFNAL